MRPRFAIPALLLLVLAAGCAEAPVRDKPIPGMDTPRHRVEQINSAGGPISWDGR